MITQLRLQLGKLTHFLISGCVLFGQLLAHALVFSFNCSNVLIAPELNYAVGYTRHGGSLTVRRADYSELNAFPTGDGTQVRLAGCSRGLETAWCASLGIMAF